MSHEELPVKVHGILALTQMIIVHESGPEFHFAFDSLLTCRCPVRNSVSPQIGKLVQGEDGHGSSCVIDAYLCPDLLKLCDETELESLNTSLKAIVAYYQEELLPVAVELTVRLVRHSSVSNQNPTHLENPVRYLLTFSCGGRSKDRGNL